MRRNRVKSDFVVELVETTVRCLLFPPPVAASL